MGGRHTVKNIRISTDILWRVHRILTEPVPHTFVWVNRASLFRRFKDDTNVKPVSLKYGNLAIQYIRGYTDIFTGQSSWTDAAAAAVGQHITQRHVTQEAAVVLAAGWFVVKPQSHNALCWTATYTHTYLCRTSQRPLSFSLQLCAFRLILGNFYSCVHDCN